MSLGPAVLRHRGAECVCFTSDVRGRHDGALPAARRGGGQCGRVPPGECRRLTPGRATRRSAPPSRRCAPPRPPCGTPDLLALGRKAYDEIRAAMHARGRDGGRRREWNLHEFLSGLRKLDRQVRSCRVVADRSGAFMGRKAVARRTCAACTRPATNLRGIHVSIPSPRSRGLVVLAAAAVLAVGAGSGAVAGAMITGKDIKDQIHQGRRTSHAGVRDHQQGQEQDPQAQGPQLRGDRQARHPRVPPGPQGCRRHRDLRRSQLVHHRPQRHRQRRLLPPLRPALGHRRAPADGNRQPQASAPTVRATSLPSGTRSTSSASRLRR